MPLATVQRSPRIRKGFVFASRKSGLLSSVTPASRRIDVLKRRPPCGSAFFYPRKRAVAGNTRHNYTLGATPFRAPFSYSLDKAAGKMVTHFFEKRAKKTPRHRLGRLNLSKKPLYGGQTAAEAGPMAPVCWLYFPAAARFLRPWGAAPSRLPARGMQPSGLRPSPTDAAAETKR